MAIVEAFKAFLKSRELGFKQRSPAWLDSRRNTIGGSEISALRGSSYFESPQGLLAKKVQPANAFNVTACTWGTLFEPLVQEYIERKHSVSVFGHDIALGLGEDHPLYKKVTCSPDGYFVQPDGTIVLLEFKCPFKRQIARNVVPPPYRDQVQMGLSLSGETVTQGLFIDAYFRMCSWDQLKLGMVHNPNPNGGKNLYFMDTSPLAWGVCFLFAKPSRTTKRKRLISLGSPKTSQTMFERIMHAITEKKLWCSYGEVRLGFTEEDYQKECRRMNSMLCALSNPGQIALEGATPVAYFAWKLLDISEIPVMKNPDFLTDIQEEVEMFHLNLNTVRRRIRECIENPQVPHTLQIPQPPQRQTVIESSTDVLDVDSFLNTAFQDVDLSIE